ncbi:hypothetical protein [Sporomusa sp.]|uniref:hypothetical protein n=1 Tax=Sporomusa sp. TaxID=2078658 RepID=UPI002CD5E289|nr:hypothetical protein [Sporomusa sp.]HWR08144.1 hypothetical protein [Sporomusa sp.]
MVANRLVKDTKFVASLKARAEAYAQDLDNTQGVGPHTISVPRIRPASGMDLTKSLFSQ